MVVELALQHLVGVVDAKLFEAVRCHDLKSCNDDKISKSARVTGVAIQNSVKKIAVFL